MKRSTLLTFIILLIQYKIIQTFNITLPKTNVVHGTSGLILHYLSEYKPANRIVTFTVSIPMVPDMCYLIPIKSMKKIPQCNQSTPLQEQKPRLNEEQLLVKFLKNSAVHYRKKRLIGDIISIGIGSAALSLSTFNTIQMANLKSEMQHVTESLNALEQATNSHTAQIQHLNEGQVQLAYALNYTQIALNRTIDLVNEHSEIIRSHENAIRTLSDMTMFLSNRLSSVVHAVETHFILTSIDNILANKLNLQFIHHKDLPKVAEMVMEVANVSLDETVSNLTPIELVTRLLVQQRIDFRPMNQTQYNEASDIIGQLIFSSFFAAPNKQQPPFSLYELIPVPFNLGQQRVKLAQVPYIIGFEPINHQFIRWSKSEAESCNFMAMTTCRETPPIRKESIDSCLIEILNDQPLHSCQTETHLDPIFVHRLGSHWIISTNTSTKCHEVKTSETGSLRIGPMKEVVLPPIALIAIPESTSLSCDHFFLPGHPIQVGPIISLLENTTIHQLDTPLINLHEKLMNSTKWSKLPYIPPHIKAMIDFISNTPMPAQTITHLSMHSHWNPYIMISCVVIMLLLSGFVLYRTRTKRNKQSNLTIALPTWKHPEEIQMMKVEK